MTIIPNDKVVVSLQDENTVASLQGTSTVHPEVDPADEVEPENSQPQVPRRSTKERRSAIANDYIHYLQEHEFDIGLRMTPHPWMRPNSVFTLLNGQMTWMMG